jgi:thioredoxin family protein
VNGNGVKKVNRNGNKPTLRIYVGKHCWSCDEALRLAKGLRKKFAGLNIEIINLDSEDSVNHDDVFSTPTYVLNGRTISLGNPTCEELVASVSALLD